MTFCGVIDAQGFYVNGKFVAREIALVSDKLSICIPVIIDVSKQTLEDRRKNDYIIRHLTGLPIRSSCKNGDAIHCGNVKSTLMHLYYATKQTSGDFLACKNHELYKLLESLQIPVKLLDNSCPTLSELDKLYESSWMCPEHKKGIWNCAYRKCFHIWRWLKEKRETDNLIERLSKLSHSHGENVQISWDFDN